MILIMLPRLRIKQRLEVPIKEKYWVCTAVCVYNVVVTLLEAGMCLLGSWN